MRLPRLAPIALVLVLATGCVKKSTHARAVARVHDLEAQVQDRDRRIATLEGDLGRTRGDLDKLTSGKSLTEEELKRVRGEKEASDAELAEVQAKREADQKRLAAYQDLQRRFQSLVSTGTLEVAFRNGQMTLKLPSGVLFPSGSADISEAGGRTLTEVTKVLMAFKDRRFQVVGHTDNVPIATEQFKNNWYLSTARAVSVVEYMIGQGFPADQLAAAGYSDKDPVASNKTAKGRKQNRRIEIILLPDLSELPKLAKTPK